MKTKKLFLTLLILLLAIPLSYAQEEDKCGLTNLASCIPEKFYEFTLSIINAPLQPLLEMTKGLLSEPVDINAFSSLWAIIVYMISLFYGLFILFAGFNMIVAGYSAERRENAKLWLKNIILMLLFVQASFYLYAVVLELSSSITASIINLIDPQFFLLTVDNVVNVGLQLVLAIPYLFVLLVSIILLSLRYLLVAVGVVFFPIGLFFNFIPPLQSTGRFIINILALMIFLPFVQSLILLAASMLLNVPIFQGFKIVIMIASFLLINLTVTVLTTFTASKSAFVNKTVASIMRK